jgi:hypothetical protein
MKYKQMSGYWSSASASPFGAAPATGGRRRRTARRGGEELVAGRRRRHSRRGGEELVAGRRRRGGAEMPPPPPADVKEAASQLAGADAPKTMEGGRKRHTKAKKVAKALLKLSKKLEKGGRRRRGGGSMY